ncbi:MAG: hypothetical protein RR944_08590, partial [Acinetobacter sp.]|uniref:hypothetical protein n=3 Tax=Acinetobacter sp. TaxID=472 RepID=UPI002FC71FB1
MLIFKNILSKGHEIKWPLGIIALKYQINIPNSSDIKTGCLTLCFHTFTLMAKQKNDLGHQCFCQGHLMNIHTQRLLLCALISAALPSAFANAPAIDLAVKENDRIQQNLQDRLRYEQEQLLQSSKPPARIEIAQPETKQPEKGPCITIATISVDGATV